MKDGDLIFGLMASFDKEAYSFEDIRYLTAPFGITESSLRTNLSRMSTAEIIQRERRGINAYYSFDRKGRQIKKNVSHGFISLNWDRWDRAFWGIIFSVPITQAEQRHAIRKKLSTYRFACLNSGFWIRPAHQSENISETLESILSTGFCRLIKFFNYSELTPEQMIDLWDLDRLNQDFYAGLDMLKYKTEKLKTRIPKQALIDKMIVGNTIVKLISKDPMLPPQFWPRNWQGEAIREKFRHFDTLATQMSQTYWKNIFLEGAHENY